MPMAACRQAVSGERDKTLQGAAGRLPVHAIENGFHQGIAVDTEYGSLAHGNLSLVLTNYIR